MNVLQDLSNKLYNSHLLFDRGIPKSAQGYLGLPQKVNDFYCSFLPSKKNNKPKAKSGIHFFIALKACAMPSEKMDTAFRQNQPHNYQRMINVLLNNAKLFMKAHKSKQALRNS